MLCLCGYFDVFEVCVIVMMFVFMVDDVVIVFIIGVVG